MMLLAAMLTRHMSKALLKGNVDCAKRADKMNRWAFGAIAEAPDEGTAHRVLEAKVCDRWTAIDIAMHTDAKAFLSQPFCVSLYEHWWRGGSADSSIMLETNFSWILVVLQIFLPFLNPDVRNPREKEDGADVQQYNVYAALG